MSARIVTGDVRDVLPTLEAAYDERGRFVKGTHWRPHQPFRERAWLEREYVECQRSTAEIAAEFGVSDVAISYWLRRHQIPRRSTSHARSVKHWGASGETNPMFGKTGDSNPNWRGGHTPERQAFYASQEWSAVARTVWLRDGAACRRCYKRATQHGSLDVHHIVSFAVAGLRAEPSNLVLLCRSCHGWVHSRRNAAREFIAEWGGGDGT